MSATIHHLPVPRPRFAHYCWPYNAAGVIRAACNEHFGQVLPADVVGIVPKAGAR